MAKANTKSRHVAVAADEKSHGDASHIATNSAAEAHFLKAKALRQTTPREAHKTIGTFPAARDPVGLILASNNDRVAALVPVRHTRMLESPFTFYRGTAALQAYDLAYAPASGIQCAMLWRRSSDELRWLCDARAPVHLRPQRFRRDVPGSV
jgi:hypothetical protein